MYDSESVPEKSIFSPRENLRNSYIYGLVFRGLVSERLDLSFTCLQFSVDSLSIIHHLGSGSWDLSIATLTLEPPSGGP